MINKDLFNKYKDIKVVSDGTLFGIQPIVAVTHKVCPYCYCKLYLMRNGKFYYCKSKKNKHKFIISKSKINE